MLLVDMIRQMSVQGFLKLSKAIRGYCTIYLSVTKEPCYKLEVVCPS